MEEEEEIEIIKEQISSRVLNNVILNLKSKQIPKYLISLIFEGVQQNHIALLLDTTPQNINNFFHPSTKIMKKEKNGKLKRKYENTKDQLSHCLNFHYGYPIYTGTKNDLLSKIKDNVPDLGRSLFNKAMKELHVHKSHRPAVDLWSCEKCDPIKIQEIKNYEISNSQSIEQLLKSDLFIENLTKKHRIVVKNYLENDQFDKAKEYFSIIENQNLKKESLIRINSLKAEIDIHHRAIKIQNEIFKKQKKDLLNNECLILIDFSGQPTRKEGRAHILNFSIIKRGIQSHMEEINYMDFFFDQDYSAASTLASAWKIFFDKQETILGFKSKKIYIWTDRGGSDFINYEVLYFYQCLRKTCGVPMIISTFESLHGHSICDAHFGRGKRKIRHDINLEISSLRFTRAFVSECFSKLKNTTSYKIIPIIKKSKIDPKKEFAFKITEYRCFDFTNENLEKRKYTAEIMFYEDHK